MVHLPPLVHQLPQQQPSYSTQRRFHSCLLPVLSYARFRPWSLHHVWHHVRRASRRTTISTVYPRCEIPPSISFFFSWRRFVRRRAKSATSSSLGLASSPRGDTPRERDEGGEQTFHCYWRRRRETHLSWACSCICPTSSCAWRDEASGAQGATGDHVLAVRRGRGASSAAGTGSLTRASGGEEARARRAGRTVGARSPEQAWRREWI